MTKDASLLSRIPRTISRGLRKLLIDNKSCVDEFCTEFHVELLDIGITYENTIPEPVYLFSDNLGYYTLKGIQNSLEH